MNPPTTTSARLVVRGVSHAFALKTVLEDIDLDIEAGRITALVGPSGCGKTTLLHLCAGLATLRTGRIDNGFARPACVFQQPRLLPWKSALDNIALGLKAAGVAARERVRQAYAIGVQMGLAADDLERFPHQLSGGMQSRVALARALVLDPDLLLLDEPFSALDIGLKAELYALLLHHLARRSMGVMIITHDLMEAVRLSDTILVMAPDPGRIVRRFDLARAAISRDDAFVYRTTGAFLQDVAVRESFGLAPIDDSSHACSAAAAAVADGATVVELMPSPATTRGPARRGVRC
ncbi:MAG TPA: ATP-binding cassette domain-containing protein [Rhodocyclaceae bacterium]|nr:ATP-binding cassette domain-containing protein [Rhodocyclaceae bacterium]